MPAVMRFSMQRAVIVSPAAFNVIPTANLFGLWHCDVLHQGQLVVYLKSRSPSDGAVVSWTWLVPLCKVLFVISRRSV